MTTYNPIHYHPRFNHCAIQLKRIILNKEGYPIFSIKFNKKKPKKFIPPTTKNLVSETKYLPNVKRIKAYGRIPKEMINNNLFFYVRRRKKFKGGVRIMEIFISGKGTKPGSPSKRIPNKHFLEVDKTNKRLRLVGKKYHLGWVKFNES